MFSITPITYARRHNPDGTTDSICKNCLVTIVTAWREIDLNRAEHSHTCDPNVLNYWKDMMERGERPWLPSFEGEA
jgi:hypothetical protein